MTNKNLQDKNIGVLCKIPRGYLKKLKTYFKENNIEFYSRCLDIGNNRYMVRKPDEKHFIIFNSKVKFVDKLALLKHYGQIMKYKYINVKEVLNQLKG
jgi:hypothetical protein